MASKLTNDTVRKWRDAAQQVVHSTAHLSNREIRVHTSEADAETLETCLRVLGMPDEIKVVYWEQ